MTESETGDVVVSPSPSGAGAGAGAGSRAVQEVLLLANDVSVVDRSGLSLWHFEQLTKPLFASSAAANATPVEPEESDSGGEGLTNAHAATAAAAAAVATATNDGDATAMELEDGMAIAAITFQSDAPEAPQDAAITELKCETERPHRLTLASRVRLVYKRYRCVLYLDASPSTLSIDPLTGKVFLDTLYESTEVRVCFSQRQIGGT
ncbi:hypothetical protein PINS_up008781 [Pythium insidiosum]|nr:hypothetical protein PINS_up008781 [Pythium insidiosum]